MYFHTDNPKTIEFISSEADWAVQFEKRLRINVDDEGNLTFKIGEGMWSAPIASTPDPYRDEWSR